VKWSSVEYVLYIQFIPIRIPTNLTSTDPSTFNIYLVNNAIYPTVSKKIASDVKTSSDSYTIDSVDATAG
jgi:hypothetical protein